MIDWQRLVRAELPALAVRPEREAEVVEELARLLEDAATEQALGDPSEAPSFDEAEARAFLKAQIPEWAPLVREVLRGEPRSQRPLTLPRQGSPLVSYLFHDIRYASRRLRKSPLFTLVAVLTLGLGIGLAASIFGVIDGLFFEPLPVEEPGALMMVHSRQEGDGLELSPLAYADFRDLRHEASHFEDMAAAYYSMVVLEAGSTEGFAVVEAVTGDYFRALGVEPILGRAITAEEDRRGSRVAVLAHGSWQQRFGGDPEVLGRALRLNGEPLTIIGVAPEGFGGLLRGLAPELWLPMGAGEDLRAWPTSSSGERTESLPLFEDRGFRFARVVGRIAPGIPRETASAGLVALGDRLRTEYPDSHEDWQLVTSGPNAFAAFPGADRFIHGAAAVLMSIVGLVLLIASANLANMLLARAAGRRQEIATRLALGAGRGQVVRQLLTESLLLASCGGLLGLGLAASTQQLFPHLGLTAIGLHVELGLELRIVLFTLGISTLVAIAFGLAPALETSRVDLATTLRESGRGTTSGRGRRSSAALVVGQVALALMLLICAGLAMRSFEKAHRMDPGFEAEGVVTARLAPTLQGYSEAEAEALYDSLVRQLRTRGDMVSVATSRQPPLTPWEYSTAEVAAAAGSDAADRPLVADLAAVDEAFFDTLRLPILHGRGFASSDTADSAPVVVINETLAELLWPGDVAVERELLLGRSGGSERQAYRVVGIVRNAKYRTLGEAPRPCIYRSLEQFPATSRVILARHSGSRAAVLAALRQEIRQHDESLAVTNLGTLRETIGGAYLIPTLVAGLFGTIGAIGLLLAALGLYGVIAYSASQRTHEIGIRMAMGASRLDVLALVLRQGLVLTAWGLLLGIGGALAGTRVLGAVLVGIDATDPVTFVAVPAFLIAVAILACWFPARRAAAADPQLALRHD